MIDIAERGSGGCVAMKDVAARQKISRKYLERIMPLLVANSMIEGIQGKGGGYRLTRTPSAYSVGEILRAAEGDLAPVPCLGWDAKTCDNTDECRTLPIWHELHDRINDYLDSITLADLMRSASPS